MILQKLINGQNLTSEESMEVMTSIVDKKYTDAQIGGLLLSLQHKGICSEELCAFVEVLDSLAVHIHPAVDELVDTCGTGGDKSNTFNISTLSALVLAGGGVAVAKHGNRSVSSYCGSADVLEKLGVAVALTPHTIERCIEKIGIGFLFAPTFHPAFKNVAPIRAELGVRTVFNILGPLLNPAPVTCQVIGVFDPALFPLYAEVLKRQGRNGIIVHGDGLDELSLCARTEIMQVKKGKIISYSVVPEDVGLKRCSLDALKSRSVKHSAAIFESVLQGEESACKDAVLLNAAAGLLVAGRSGSLMDGVGLARDIIDSGKARVKFNQLKRETNDLRQDN